MDKSEWQGAQGETWANEWRRTDRSFTTVTEKLLSRIRSLRFKTVLDIGCGAGELSLAIARAYPDARVKGVDVSPQLVEASRERGANLANVSFDLCDAAVWQAPSGFAPQLLVSRHGVMFFDEPVGAFTNLARQSDSGANLLFSCFRSPVENPFFTDVMDLLPEGPPPPPPGSPGPFGFADPDRIRKILSGGGWESIAVDAFDFPMIVGAGAEPLSDAVDYFCAIGPAARLIAGMEDNARADFRHRVRELARRNLADGIVSMPASGWIVSARKA